MRYLFFLSLLSFTYADLASAIPMLRDTRADYEKKIVTIYPDHADQNVFYFLPNSSEFARHDNGAPTVGLTLWNTKDTDPQNGGGLLSFVLQSAMSPEVQKELADFKTKHPNARLSVVPFGQSYISGPDANVWKSLVTDMDLPPHAGVAETEVGVNMLLTETGAKVFASIVNGSSNPFNVQLCFDVLGSTPLMDAEVTVNYKKVYEHFSAQASYGVLWWRASVKTEVEKLIEDGTVSIKILGGDATFEDYVKSFVDEFIKTYMTPSLANTPNGNGSGTMSFNYTYKEERKTAKMHMTKSQFITDNRCVPLAFKSLQPWANKLITYVD